MGAEAIKELLMDIDVEKEAEQLKSELFEATGQKKQKSLRDWKFLKRSEIQVTSLNG